ncbi:MAG: hypothetical protein CHACPFDD_02033 [Phycisphaerae bacterium]|nr:hypothetical protein [Phycisphaerae bacterium]
MTRNAMALSAVRTSQRAYDEQVGEAETLDCGVAHFSEAYPELPECNFVSEVLLANAATPAEAVAEIQRFYSGRGLCCRRWVPAAEQPPELLAALLEPIGLRPRVSTALLLKPDECGAAHPAVRIVPARAMRRACGAIFEQALGRGDSADAARVAVALERLGQPSYDGFVALRDDAPAGFVAVHQVGEIGRVRELFVCGEHRRGGVGRTLVGYAVATARRWALHPICAAVPSGDEASSAAYRRAGFVAGGELVEFG